MGSQDKPIQTAESKAKYKVLYIGNFAKVSVGEPEVAKGFEELGHEVVRWEERGIETNIKRLEQEIKNNDYDFVLYAKFRVDDPINRKEFIKDCPIPTIMWGFDLYYGL